MSTTISVQCTAKLNLTLAILGLLADGYHKLDTLYQSVNLDDTVFFTFDTNNSQIGFVESGNDVPSEFPLDQNNLIIKAINLYKLEVEAARNIGVQVRISKQIPIGGGLAGGSSNAAAALYAMNTYFENALTTAELRHLAAKLGSDIPFCLHGGCARGTNRGENLEPMPHATVMHFLLSKPRDLSISTPAMYKAFDQHAEVLQKRPDTQAACQALEEMNLKKLAEHMGNDFEPVVFSLHPQLKLVCDDMLDNSALAAHLSGSGPTLFGLFKNELDAQIARASLEAKFPQNQNWVCQSSQYGVVSLDLVK